MIKDFGLYFPELGGHKYTEHPQRLHTPGHPWSGLNKRKRRKVSAFDHAKIQSTESLVLYNSSSYTVKCRGV
jgi:hypothetical protein